MFREADIRAYHPKRDATPAKPPRRAKATAPETSSRSRYRIDPETIAAGRLPQRAPVVTSAANPHYQKHFDRLFELAQAGDWDGVRNYEVKGSNSYSKMVARYRRDLLAVHGPARRARLVDLLIFADAGKEVDALIDRQSSEPEPEKRRQSVWETERRLARDASRPIIFYTRAATCWRPRVKGLNLWSSIAFSTAGGLRTCGSIGRLAPSSRVDRTPYLRTVACSARRASTTTRSRHSTTASRTARNRPILRSRRFSLSDRH
jgi:hypothetical protein